MMINTCPPSVSLITSPEKEKYLSSPPPTSPYETPPPPSTICLSTARLLRHDRRASRGRGCTRLGRLYGAYLSPLRFRGKCERKGKEKGNLLVLSMLCGDGEGKGVSVTVIKVGRRQTNEPDEPRPAIRLCPVLFPCAEMLSSYVGRFKG